MNHIPSLIPNVVFIGDTNAGKSTLVNQLVQQDVSIVSDIPGTTTDEVRKRYELLGVGPINIIDTAGRNDQSALAAKRVSKTNKAFETANLIVYVVDASSVFDLSYYNEIEYSKVLVFNKVDLLNTQQKKVIELDYPNALMICSYDNVDILEQYLYDNLSIKERFLLSDIKLHSNIIVQVIPIDSEAPKGRIILPQMQLLRECLDFHYQSVVIQTEELEALLKDNPDVGLVVCDSSVFDLVSRIVQNRYPLTSYSILQANQKGDLSVLIDGLREIDTLKDDSHILIMESCSHSTSHEDIGNVKIPRILRKLISERIVVDYRNANDFPSNLNKYSLIVHCGSCMLNEQVMLNRIRKAQAKKIPITNYGLIFAYYSGILDEAISVFTLK